MLIKVECNSVNSHAYLGRLRLYKGRLQQSKIILLKSRSQCSINKPSHNVACFAHSSL